MQQLTFGDATVSSVMEFQGAYRNLLDMLPDATPAHIDKHRDWLEPDCLDKASGNAVMAFQSYVVQMNGLNVLIDACVGNDKNRPLRPDWHRQNWPWLENYNAIGIPAEEIDLVMCTHLHVDHIGWNTKLQDGKWVPTFPNASYLFSESEFRHWETAYKTEDWMTDAFEDSVLPIMEAGKAELVASDHQIRDNFWLEPTPGHTPGHFCIHLEGGPDEAIFTGDLMHHPIQVPESQLSSIFCLDPVKSAATRTDFVERHTDAGTVILPAHFPSPSAGRIVSDGDRRKFEFVN